MWVKKVQRHSVPRHDDNEYPDLEVLSLSINVTQSSKLPKEFEGLAPAGLKSSVKYLFAADTRWTAPAPFGLVHIKKKNLNPKGWRGFLKRMARGRGAKAHPTRARICNARH